MYDCITDCIHSYFYETGQFLTENPVDSLKIENKFIYLLNNQTKVFQHEQNNYFRKLVFSASNSMSLVHGMYKNAV
jgi:hypothetical protein